MLAYWLETSYLLTTWFCWSLCVVAQRLDRWQSGSDTSDQEQMLRKAENLREIQKSSTSLLLELVAV